MPVVSVVLVEPKHQCNVGFIARSMKNFGLSKLYFYGMEFTPNPKAYECSAHAKEILEGSKNLGKSQIKDEFDFIVGTTSKPHFKESSPRNTLTPREFADRIKEVDGSVALLLGREDKGLSNEELDICDIAVCIPASDIYGTLNISHAGAILFYELWQEKNEADKGNIRKASGKEKEALMGRLEILLDSVDYPNYKKKVAQRIFRKVIGRAGISAREAHTIAGILKEADDEIKRKNLI